MFNTSVSQEYFNDEGNFIIMTPVNARVMTIAFTGNCEVSKNVTVEYLDNFKIPNVITVNGDGINDQWILPNSYSNKAEVNVIIFNSAGKEVLNEFNYQNNWPETSMTFAKQNMVFFYKIKDTNEVLKQGTITIIR